MYIKNRIFHILWVMFLLSNRIILEKTWNCKDIVAWNIGLPDSASHRLFVASLFERYTPANINRPWRSTRSISLQVSPNTRFPSRFVISRIIPSVDSGKKSWKLDLMSSTWDVTYRVGPGVIFMFFSLTLLSLSCGDEDQSKCPLLDWTVSSGSCSSGASPSPSVDWSVSSRSGSKSVVFHFRDIFLYLCFSFSALFIMSKNLDQNLFDRELLGQSPTHCAQSKRSARQTSAYIYGVCVKVIHW